MCKFESDPLVSKLGTQGKKLQRNGIGLTIPNAHIGDGAASLQNKNGHLHAVIHPQNQFIFK